MNFCTAYSTQGHRGQLHTLCITLGGNLFPNPRDTGLTSLPTSNRLNQILHFKKIIFSNCFILLSVTVDPDLRKRYVCVKINTSWMEQGTMRTHTLIHSFTLSGYPPNSNVLNQICKSMFKISKLKKYALIVNSTI